MRPLVVVGDALLDVDLSGTADRLAPDAPVPVVADPHERRRPGGAGLAAALAARATDREVVLVCPLADDEDAGVLRELLAAAGVRVLPVPAEGTTTVKRRVRAGEHPLLRIDTGERGALGPVPAEALDAVASAAAVLVSDYGRGVTGHDDVRRAVAATRAPVVWDPHPRGTAPVPGVQLATPNRDEARRLADRVDVGAGLAAATDDAATLVRRWRAQAVCVTLGAGGALLSHGEGSPSVLPAPRVTVDDPCGAGDRFAAAAATALADGAVSVEAVEQAVAAAAEFLATGGVAAYDGERATPEPEPDLDPVARVRARGGTVVATGGCFDLLHAGHVATLEAARALGDCLVVCLNSDDSVRRLKGPDRPLQPQHDRARVLAALDCVDEVVVFGEDTPTRAIERIRPDVWAKGGDYAGAELPEATLLRRWGGQSVVLPYLSGRSTTRLVASARAGAQS